MEESIVVSTRFPYLEVVWITQPGRGQDWAYMDTGYTGFFIVPATLLTDLGPPRFTVRLSLGDGSPTDAHGYWGSVQIVGLGQQFSGRILALGTEFLLGRQMMDRLKLTFDHGQRVFVES